MHHQKTSENSYRSSFGKLPFSVSLLLHRPLVGDRSLILPILRFLSAVCVVLGFPCKSNHRLSRAGERGREGGREGGREREGGRLGERERERGRERKGGRPGERGRREREGGREAGRERKGGRPGERGR